MLHITALDQHIAKLRGLAKQYNMSLVMTPCCPICQEYGKHLERIMALHVPCVLDESNSRDGFIVQICGDCKPEANKLIQDILFWSKSGFATVHYVESDNAVGG